MKLLVFLLAITPWSALASTSLKMASRKKLGRLRDMPVAKEVLPKTSPRTKKARKENVDERGSGLVVKIELEFFRSLPTALSDIVADYLDDDTSYIPISTYNWPLEDTPRIAVDGARLYAISLLEGMQALDHFSESAKESEQLKQSLCCIEFSSSRNGESIFSKHVPEGLTGLKYRWLVQCNKPGGYKYAEFDNKDIIYGILSRDGQTLCACNYCEQPLAMHVYQLAKEPGKDPTASEKCAIEGEIRAISGNRVVAGTRNGFEVHDMDTGKLAWKLGKAKLQSVCASNGDGSEVAFVSSTRKLHVMKAANVVGIEADLSTAVTVEASDLRLNVDGLAYDDENKLYVHFNNSKVSLFDPSNF